jgi:hypothetical protein
LEFFDSGFGIWAGNYAILARKVRAEAYQLLRDILVDPLNQFLAFQSKPLLPNFEDRKRFPLTVGGQPCDSPCRKKDGTYFWCGSGDSWDYW